MKSNDYYSLIISTKTQLPNNFHRLKRYFNLPEEDLKLAFTLPHIIAYEPFVKAFQHKILNSILYANTKLFKIGYSELDKCTFCSNESETLHHLFFYCHYSSLFWKSFEKDCFTVSKQLNFLSLQDIVIGITAPSCPLVNYLILIGKMHIWDCRRKALRPTLEVSN